MGYSGLGLGYHAKRFEGRMETTKDTSHSMLTLKLSGLRAEDSAAYYCARETQWCEWVEDLYKNTSENLTGYRVNRGQ
jgi:hypothetical protein